MDEPKKNIKSCHLVVEFFIIMIMMMIIIYSSSTISTSNGHNNNNNNNCYEYHIENELQTHIIIYLCKIINGT